MRKRRQLFIDECCPSDMINIKFCETMHSPMKTVIVLVTTKYKEIYRHLTSVFVTIFEINYSIKTEHKRK